jgi:hypothetical protein
LREGKRQDGSAAPATPRAEGYDPVAGRQLGNFSQAFRTLINTAFVLDGVGAAISSGCPALSVGGLEPADLPHEPFVRDLGGLPQLQALQVVERDRGPAASS